MSRGIGKTQAAILKELENAPDGMLIPALASAVGISTGQVYRATRSLKQRNLVLFTRTGALGWRGLGEYGPLIMRTAEHGPEVPTAQVIRKGDPWPWPDQYGLTGRAARDVELVRGGMPIPAALVVWHPECYMEFAVNFVAMMDALHRQNGGGPLEDDPKAWARIDQIIAPLP